MLILLLLFGGFGGWYGYCAGWYSNGNPMGYGFGGLVIILLLICWLFGFAR